MKTKAQKFKLEHPKNCTVCANWDEVSQATIGDMCQVCYDMLELEENETQKSIGRY